MIQILPGDCRVTLKDLPDNSCRCCVTSPPYWGLRNYGVDGQIGLERTPMEYLEHLVEMFREVRRVLSDDGTLWLNLGDSYSQGNKGNSGEMKEGYKQATNIGSHDTRLGATVAANRSGGASGICKPKDLIGIPWMAAFALRDDGWYLRSEITWCKRSPMPESVTDRPSCATEKIFLLSKSPNYFYDAAAVRNPPSEALLKQIAEGYNGEALKGFEANGVQNASDVKSRIINGARKRIDKQRGHSRRHAGFNDRWDHLSKDEQMACGSNMRNYWLLGPEPFLGSHYATFPSEIPRRCILAGSAKGDTILDPFSGSGTTGQVAIELGRKAILCELNPEYVKLIESRTNVTPGML